MAGRSRKQRELSSNRKKMRYAFPEDGNFQWILVLIRPWCTFLEWISEGHIFRKNCFFAWLVKAEWKVPRTPKLLDGGYFRLKTFPMNRMQDFAYAKNYLLWWPFWSEIFEPSRITVSVIVSYMLKLASLGSMTRCNARISMTFTLWLRNSHWAGR